MDRQRKACLLAGLAALLWSTAPTAFKIALRRLDPLQLLLYASVVSTVALFGVLAAQKKTFVPVFNTISAARNEAAAAARGGADLEIERLLVWIGLVSTMAFGRARSGSRSRRW